MTPLQILQKIFDYVSRISVVGFIIILAFAVLALPDQTREIYAVYAQAFKDRLETPTGEVFDYQIVRQFYFGWAGMLLLSLVVWACALRLLHIARTTETQDSPPLRRHLAAAVIAGFLPVLVLYVGFHGAAKLYAGAPAPSETDVLISEVRLLRWSAAALAGSVALILLIVHLAWRKRLTPILATLFSARWFIGVCVLLAATIAAFFFSSRTVPAYFGSLAIITGFLMFLCYLLTVFASVRRMTGIPVTLLLILYGIGLAWTGWNDNHKVEVTISPDADKAKWAGMSRPEPVEVSAFKDWYRNRADREHYAKAGKPYPIFIVSAEGGGLYAGYNAASFLATLQDECANFSQHVLAISSVSGGSLGAAVFSSLADQQASNAAYAPCLDREDAGPFRTFVDRYFADDFLSPLVSATLFPDFLQRLWPLPVYRLDRAKALERSFETAWDNAAIAAGAPPAGNPFNGFLNQLGGGGSAAPYLMLHSTSVSLGSRITMGGLEIDPSPTANHFNQAVLGQCATLANADLKLSSAVSLSARFPWLTPVGWIKRPEDEEIEALTGCVVPESLKASTGRYGRRVYLADGGIFENSGLEAAVELKRRLQAIASSHEFRREFAATGAVVEFHIIAISAFDESYTQWFDGDGFALSEAGYGEIASPLVALMSTRVARTRVVENSELIVDRAKTDGPTEFECSVPNRTLPFQSRYHRVAVDTADYVLPLGWYLSEITRKNIGEPRAFWHAFSRCQIRQRLSLATPPDPAKPWEPCLSQALKSDADARKERGSPPFKPANACTK